jgi:tetratricopeptide (TPR) repeat protein
MKAANILIYIFASFILTQKNMKRLLLLLLVSGFALAAAGQKAPKWMDKASKAVITVTTFDKDNRQINATTGFFVSPGGEALSAYSLFKGASRASVSDADGHTWPVTSIIGADDLYDVIKFKVALSGKAPFLPLAADPVPVSTAVWLLPFRASRELVFRQGSIAEASKLKEPYLYYKIAMPLEAENANAPLLLANGQVFALAQVDASGKKEHSYGVSAAYVQALNYTATDIFNTVYTDIGIRKAWPAEVGQATVALFLLAGSQDAKAYLESLNDFIASFPQSPDGYLSRASHYALQRAELASSAAEEGSFLRLALDDLATALKVSDKKGDVLYNRAKLIYSVATADSSLTDANWQIAAAREALQKAILLDDQPVYHELEGELCFNQGEYPQAYEAWMKVNYSNMATSNTWYLAAKALENIPGSQISDIISLLDSAILKMGTPTPKEAAPYLLERIDYLSQLSLFDEAVKDYDRYYYLSDGKVNDSFYYYRSQARSRNGDAAGALEDIQEAIRKNASSADYYAEEAALYVRQQNYDAALLSVDKALELAPAFAACYRIRGVCFIRQEKKVQACEAFQKALELGDPVVARLIREHC